MTDAQAQVLAFVLDAVFLIVAGAGVVFVRRYERVTRKSVIEELRRRRPK